LKTNDTYLSFLVEQIAKEGDEKSFEALFKLFYKPLCRFAERYVHSRSIAEEVVSDVFVKIWNNREKLAEVQHMETYLYVAVKNQSLTRISHLSEHFITPFDEDFTLERFMDSADPAQTLELQELQTSIDLAVEGLPHQCRMVFKLIKEDGFKYKEVAEVLNLSVRTVEAHLATALKKLSASLRAHLPVREKSSTKR